MNEKSLFVATELLGTSFNTETGKFNDIMLSKLANWNPTLLMCMQRGFKSTLRMLIKFHVVCRGVRVLKGLEDVITPSASVSINGAAKFVVKQWRGVANAAGNNFADPTQVRYSYYEAGPTAVANYARAFYNTYNLYPQVPVFTATELTRAKYDDAGL